MASHFFWSLKTTIQMLQMIPSQKNPKKSSKKNDVFQLNCFFPARQELDSSVSGGRSFLNFNFMQRRGLLKDCRLVSHRGGIYGRWTENPLRE